MSRTSQCRRPEAVFRKENASAIVSEEIITEIDDEICCARAIIVAKAIVDDHPQVKTIKYSWKPLQKQLARQLQEEARVPLGPCGLDQIKLLEIVLSDYQFVVVSAEHRHPIVHKGPESNKQIKWA